MDHLVNIANGLRGSKGKVNISKADCGLLGIDCSGESMMIDKEDLVKKVDAAESKALDAKKKVGRKASAAGDK